MNDKTVIVVSNNNPATDNVFEKLNKYGYGYIAAQLGSSDNKTAPQPAHELNKLPRTV